MNRLALFNPFQGDVHDVRFRKILSGLLLCFAILGLIIPQLPVPKIEREKLEKLPPRLAKIIIEKKKQPPPVKKPAPKKEVLKKVVPEEKVAAKPKPAPEPKPKAKPKPKPTIAKKPKPKPKKEPIVATKKERAKAREKAKQSGLVAMRDQLSSLRTTMPKPSFTRPTPKKPAEQPLAGGPKNADLIAKETAQALLSSAGTRAGLGNAGSTVNHTAQNIELVNSDEALVDSQLLNDLEEDATDSLIDAIAQDTSSDNTAQSNIRNEDSIRSQFDQNKGAIFALYNRALRKNPLLQGKVVIELTIEPSGKVSDCKIVKTELEDPRLERKLLTRIKMINFGDEDVEPLQMQYAFDFLPS